MRRDINADHPAKIVPDNIVYSDYRTGYNAQDTSEFKHAGTNRSKLFADCKNHINGIEISGIKPSAGCVNLTMFPGHIFIYIGRNASGYINTTKPKTQLITLQHRVEEIINQPSGTVLKIISGSKSWMLFWSFPSTSLFLPPQPPAVIL